MAGMAGRHIRRLEIALGWALRELKDFALADHRTPTKQFWSNFRRAEAGLEDRDLDKSEPKP
ncbi:MAG: hypothetical protein V3S55_06190 [Nitrospiraceae bacterium]